MIWVYVLAYDIWNFQYTYLNLPTHSWYCGLALLLAPTFAAALGIKADGSRTVRKLRKRIRGKKKSSQTQEIIRKQWQEQNKENKRI